MTRRGRRLRLAAVLLGLALLYPAWLLFTQVLAARTTSVDAPLVSGQEIALPVHVSWGGLFSLKILARTTDGADMQGVEGCLLDLPDPHSQPVPCEGIVDRLHLNFRLEDKRGQVMLGNYGLAMAGRYQDRNREYGPFLGDHVMGNELLILEKLDRGDYRLIVTAVHVPAQLEQASPRMLLERHADSFGFLKMLPCLLLSVLLGLVGVVMLVLGLVTRLDGN